MPVHTIDPLTDPRWTEFVSRHPQATAFHTAGWLQTLQQTYHYEPVAYTTSAPGKDLLNAIPFCRICSWLTGNRLVSLPFSDHAQPLADEDAYAQIIDHLEQETNGNRVRYFELRPIAPINLGQSLNLGECKRFYLNMLNLEPDQEALFSKFHKSCIQRTIKRAERDGVYVKTGSSAEFISVFYKLMVMTRRRHMLPPQPLKWFENIMRCMRENAKIWIAYRDNTPISAILTLTHNNKLIYKYGCSDERYFNLGGMSALFWEMIKEGKRNGATILDFGRSDLDGDSLVQFKDRWGSARLEITYFRNPRPAETRQNEAKTNWKTAAAQRIFPHLPDSLLILIGRALYRHTG